MDIPKHLDPSYDMLSGTTSRDRIAHNAQALLQHSVVPDHLSQINHKRDDAIMGQSNSAAEEIGRISRKIKQTVGDGDNLVVSVASHLPIILNTVQASGSHFLIFTGIDGLGNRRIIMQHVSCLDCSFTIVPEPDVVRVTTMGFGHPTSQ